MARVLEEMFADAADSRERGDRFEGLKDALSKSIKRHDSGADGFRTLAEAGEHGKAGILKGAGSGAGGNSANVGKLEALAERLSSITKGLSQDEAAEVQGQLDTLKGFIGDLGKDVTVASPGNLHPYDLEAPAKQLVPRFTPLRNELPRQPGKGTAREFRRILGYTNTGLGGVANLTPFFNSESDAGTPTFGSLALRRGQKISYAMDVKTVGYVEMSLSDLVTYKAYFSDLGFEDVRQLSQMALLWSHLLGEERAMLYGRGSGSGYEGVVAAPALGTIVSAGSGTGSGFGTTEFVKVTSFTGQGESLPSAEATSSTLTAGRPLIINLTSQPTGAIAYGVYVSTTTGTETFQGFFPATTTGTANQIQVNTFVSGGAVVPAADGSANANGYDGFLSVLSDPVNSGYFTRFDTTYGATAGTSVFTAGGANNVGDRPWQDAFAALYASVYADPEEVWVAAPQRRQLTDFMRNATNGTAAYRITLSESDAGSMTVGGMVSGLANESSPTSRIADLRVHPYMPVGASIIRSRVLNIPDSGISDTTAVTSVQDYMSVDWPQIQFTYDASTYWLGTLVHYAPKWSGAIYGLQ
jgi:hypothetical protein